MGKDYSYIDYNKGNMARVIGKSLPISFKQSIEICNFIRNKEVSYAKNALSKAIEKKSAIPFRKFNDNMGHKKEMAAGRYPHRASKEILDLISQVEANAQFKGLNSSNLVITHINANKAATVMHYGRKRSRKAKRTSIEIVVREKASKKEDKKREMGSEAKDEKFANQEKKGDAKIDAKKKTEEKEVKPAKTEKFQEATKNIEDKEIKKQAQKND